MKKFPILIATVLFIITASVLIQFSLAGENYVGIKKGDEYTWKVNIDEELADDIFDDSEVYWLKTSDDICEENDIFDDANLTTEGYFMDLNLSDDDWFKIQLNIGDEMWVFVWDPDAHWNPPPYPSIELHLYNNTGGLITYSNTTGSYYQDCEIVANYTGFYYIQVNNETLDGTYMYDMSIYVDEAPIPKPPKDPKDFLNWFEDIVEDYYDSEGVRFKIDEIKDEDTHKISDKWVKAVKVKCRIFKTKDYDNENKWKREDDFTEFPIVDDDERYYHRFLGLIVAEQPDWNLVAEDLEEDFELNKHHFTEIRSLSVEDLENGLKVRIKLWNDEMDDFKFTMEYGDNGVLEYAELKYGGVIVCTVDLDKGWLVEAFESGVAWVVIGLIIAAAGITTAVIVRRKIIKKKAERKLYIPTE